MRKGMAASGAGPPAGGVRARLRAPARACDRGARARRPHTPLGARAVCPGRGGFLRPADGMVDGILA